MAVSGSWYIATDNRIHVTNLKDEQGNYINSATSVIGTFTDAKKVAVAGSTPVVFTYVPASSGGWDGVLNAVDGLKEGVEYHLYIVVIAAGRKFTGRIKLKASYYEL